MGNELMKDVTGETFDQEVLASAAPGAGEVLRHLVGKLPPPGPGN